MVIVVQKELRKKSKLHKHLLKLCLYFFATLGVLFFSVFLAIRLKLTNVSGAVDVMTDDFSQNSQKSTSVLGYQTDTTVTETNNEFQKIDNQINQLGQKKMLLEQYLCDIQVLSSIAPKNITQVINIKNANNSLYIANQMLFAIKTHVSDKTKIDNEISSCVNSKNAFYISEKDILNNISGSTKINIFSWPDFSEWSVVSQSVVKDKLVIEKAASVANIEPRLIVANLVVEQLRLFFSQRELYKKFFEPLKILANANKFSLGVMSIKEETAVAIENNLKDRNSPYYLGPEYENLLDYEPSADKPSQRYARLTANDHYYNYLYGALYLKQFITQWKKEGFDLTKRPEILGTLFNVGFPQSKPNADPQVGGSVITIGQNSYSFGRLSYEFYFSGELFTQFPYINNLEIQ